MRTMPESGGGPLSTPAAVLVVGSDRRLGALVRTALSAERYHLQAVPDVPAAMDILFSDPPDLALIMEGGDGAVPVCRDLRAVDDTATIILAADADVAERVRGLTCADDFVTLPVSPEEVAARVAAVLRRTRPCRGRAVPVFDDGELRVDLAARLITLKGGPVDLTPTEYRLLAVLLGNAPRVFTHDQLLQRVWGAAFTGDSHLLRLHVANLRAKIDRPGGPGYIRTHRGVGYSFLAMVPERGRRDADLRIPRPTQR
jgi:two-component system KDP operon response regulator KdpE